MNRTTIVTLGKTIVQPKGNELDLTVSRSRTHSQRRRARHARGGANEQVAYLSTVIPGTIWAEKKSSIESACIGAQMARFVGFTKACRLKANFKRHLCSSVELVPPMCKLNLSYCSA